MKRLEGLSTSPAKCQHHWSCFHLFESTVLLCGYNPQASQSNTWPRNKGVVCPGMNTKMENVMFPVQQRKWWSEIRFLKEWMWDWIFFYYHRTK